MKFYFKPNQIKDILATSPIYSNVYADADL